MNSRSTCSANASGRVRWRRAMATNSFHNVSWISSSTIRLPLCSSASISGCRYWPDDRTWIIRCRLLPRNGAPRPGVSIHAGRIGGITTAHGVRRLAEARGLQYVNHTLKSHLSLAAALHVFAAVARSDLLEYPAGGSDLATRLTETRLDPEPDGLVRAPEAPGLGVRPNFDCMREYLQTVRIEVAAEVPYRTPGVND
jgi:hypothetical protein